jgi:hypothetical protein
MGQQAAYRCYEGAQVQMKKGFDDSVFGLA